MSTSISFLDALNLDTLDPESIKEACDAFTGNLGFDCILDFKNLGMVNIFLRLN